jgi:Uncharacterized protein conserved in bacteria (DUF2141)/Protein of unknown function (DUF2934)
MPVYEHEEAVIRRSGVDYARRDFADIPAGTYAMTVVHDENMNDKLDTNDFNGTCPGAVCKLLAYRIFDPTKAALLAKKGSDFQSQVARRACELYEQQGRRGRRQGYADPDWLQAEREIRKDERHRR